MEDFYKKKIIRDFLSLFSQSKWKNLCTYLIEYAILLLKKNYQISSLSLEDIEGFVDELIEEQERNRKKNYKKLNQNLSTSNSNYSTPQNKLTNLTQGNKPSSDWRKGENKTIFDVEENSNNNNNYYNNTNDNNNNDNNYYNNNSNRGNNFNNYNDNEITLSRISKEKIVDEILYPNKPKFKYKKSELLNFPNTNYNKNSQFKTTYKNAYTNKINTNNNKNYSYNNTNLATPRINNNKTRNFSNNKKVLSNSNSSSNLKFKSGLQMLHMSRHNSKTNVFNNNNNNNKLRSNSNNRINLHNISSKIKSQVEADKKIYNMLKKNNNNNYNTNNKKTFEEHESGISYKNSVNFLEEDLSYFD